MGKYKKSSTFNDGVGNNLHDNMPIATCLLNNDADELKTLLQAKVFKQADVLSCTIQQTVGHAFTGGRSTPVYRITCKIRRRKDGTEKTRHFIAKLVQMEEDDIKRRESYAVERRFYDHPELADWFRSEHGLTLPKLLAGDRDGKAPYQTVCWIMNDLSQSSLFPVQVSLLSVTQAKAALSWLAKFHALGWNDDQHVVWKQGVLHARGGFWSVPSGDNVDKQQLSSQWKTGMQKLVTERLLGPNEHARLVRLGQRLQMLCQVLPEFLNGQQCKLYGTWIHGDFKAANMLFEEDFEWNVDGDDLSTSVGVVDFQFTGWGLCAEDLAYLLYPDAQGSLMESMEELIDYYHDQLVTNIMMLMKGGPSSISLEALTKLFDLSTIDMTRYWLSKGWEGTTRGEAQMVLRIERTLDAIDGGSMLENSHAYLKGLLAFLEGS